MDFIEEVRALATEYAQCGGYFRETDGKKLLFLPPASMEEVRAFEQEMHLTLPDNFVRYLTELGNGGLAPDYGIYSLDELRKHNPNAAKRSEYPPMIGGGLSDDEWQAFTKAYEEAEDTSNEQTAELKARLLAGGIFIGTPGCTMNTLLMCKGAAAGQIVTIDFDYIDWYTHDPAGGWTFEDWMIEGLHRKIERKKNNVDIRTVTRYNQCGLGMSGESLTDQLVQLRIQQLRDEGAKEDIDLAPAIRDFYKRSFENGTFRLWIAVHDRKIIGTAGITFAEKPPWFACPSGKIGLLSSVYVAPEFRRRGIAKRLVGFVLRHAKRSGCGAVHITASAEGVKLYSAMGFTHNERFMQMNFNA